MATRFEILLPGDDAVRLRAAGEEALDEIERLEAQLSPFRPSSEIAHVNALAAREPVRVTPPVFGLLEHAQTLHRETAGAFDITIAPLMRLWGFRDAPHATPSPHPSCSSLPGPRLPTADDIAHARACTGMHLVHLDCPSFSVRFERPGVMLDLGAIGKGYAIEHAAELLREAGVLSALLHGGTSTVYGLGHPPDAAAWQVALGRPGAPAEPGADTSACARNQDAWPSSVNLCDESLSVSAVWGRSVEVAGRILGHVLDPRTGCPAQNAVMSAVCLSSATETDAFSTALLTLGMDGFDLITRLRPGMRALVARDCDGHLEIRTTF